MKKTAKYVLAILLMIVMMVVLTGCGDSDSESSSKKSSKSDKDKVSTVKKIDEDEEDDFDFKLDLEDDEKDDNKDDDKTTDEKSSSKSIISSKSSSSDKLVATMDASEDSYFGKYTETLEVSFKNGKASEIAIYMEFEDDEMAETVASLYKLADVDGGMKVEVEDGALKITMDPEVFAEQQGIDLDDDSLSRDAIEASLKESGFTIKK